MQSPYDKEANDQGPVIAFMWLLSHNTLRLLFIHANEVQIK